MMREMGGTRKIRRNGHLALAMQRRRWFIGAESSCSLDYQVRRRLDAGDRCSHGREPAWVHTRTGI